MSAPERFIWCTLDPARGVALVTGRQMDDLVHEAAPDARWSRQRGGWVIRIEQVADLAVLADHLRVPFRERVVS